MTIDDKTIDKLAKLSSLSIDESKREHLRSDLVDIVSFVENLNEIDVSGVDATFTTINGGQPMREDVVNSDSELTKHIINHAPKTADNYFIVPQIIE
jgi:aspartyl-tRNA(Asn)/glutamyl-tRNA(Gln) amidotransferase subunit C